MGLQEKIQHADLVAYLRGSSNAAMDSKIRKIQEEDPAYNALFELIEDIRQQTPPDMYRPPVIDKLSFEELENMLEKLLAGNANPQEQQLFFDHLLSSASFYQRLMLKLTQMTPAMAIEEMPEFAGEFVRLRSSEELLQAAGILDRPEPSVPVPGKKWSERIGEFIDKIGDLFPTVKPVYGGLSTAALAVLVILVGTNITRVPYDQYWETPAFVESGSQLRSGTRSSSGPEIQSSYYTLRVIFNAVEGSYRKGEYAEVIQKMASPGGLQYVQTLEKWEAAIEPGKAVVDSINVLEVRQLVQNYYFYLGTSQLGVFRNKKKALFEKAEPLYVTEAIRSLSKAQTLAETYNINTQDREYYYLGLAYAIQNKGVEPARQALAKVQPGSTYYPKAQELLEKLN